MKRTLAESNEDFTTFVWYAHKNAVHHNLSKNTGEWPYDSYHSMLSNSPTSLLREDVVAWFGNREIFIKFHQQAVHPKTRLKVTDL